MGSGVLLHERSSPIPKETTSNRDKQAEEVELEYLIRERAYELYQERGGEEGHEVEDWLRAEEELTAKAEEQLPKKTTPLIAA